MTTCKQPDCTKEISQRGWCHMHYMRWYRNGDPDIKYGGSRKPPLRTHKMYGAWAGMINRCHNPNNSSYGRYGAKGIYVCERWRISFQTFLADMGERPGGKTLDRINPQGPYAPDNCRWATIQEQRANISPEGDARMRKAMSEGVSRKWAEWRAAGCPEGLMPNGKVHRSSVPERANRR